MASINMLVSEIAHSLGQPNNHALRENIKSIIIHTRNELFRQSYEKHGYSDKGMSMRYVVTLTDAVDGDVELPEGYEYLGDKMTIKKTKQMVPRPVRLPNNLPFLRVSTIGSKTSVEIPYVKETSSRFTSTLPGMCGMPHYDYINDNIYLFNIDGRFSNISKIVVETPFENPSLVAELNGMGSEFHELYGDDDEWYLPEDMIGQIKDIIYKRDLLTQIRETNEVDAYHETK